MSETFTGLFDTKKYGFNVLAALAWFAGGLISWALWGVWGFFESLFVHGRLLFPFSFESLAFVAVTSAIGAVVIVGLAHVLDSDVLLPIIAGLAMVLWGVLSRSVGILAWWPAFYVPRVVMDFLAISVPVAAVVLFYRTLRDRLSAFVLGFALGGLLVQILATVVLRLPIPAGVVVEGLVVETVGGALTGLLFFAAMASHLKWGAAAAIGGEYATRPVGLIVVGWVLSLFVPGFGHLVLGYLKDGFRILGMAVGAFVLASVFSLAGVEKQWVILPLFFVWLFALRDLWGRRAGGSREVSALRRALREGSPQEKLQALHRVSKGCDPSLLPEVENAFLHEDAEISTAATEAMAGLGPAAVPALVPHLASPERSFRKRAITALRRIGNAAAREALEKHRGVEQDPELLELLRS
jgi:hypothetical protein